MKRFLFVLLLPALILTGCKDDGTAPDIEVIYSVDPASIPLDNAAHIAAVTLDAEFQSGTTALSAKWEFTSSKAWVKFTSDKDGKNATEALSGRGPQTVYLVIPENLEEGQRSAEVFLNDETTARITITQAGTGQITIAVTPASITDLISDAQTPSSKTLTVNCTNDGGSPVSVGDWTIISSATWLTLTLDPTGSNDAASVSGTGTKTVYLVATENTGSGSRTANITLNNGSTPAATVTQLEKVILPALPVPDANALDGIIYYGTLPHAQGSYVGAFWRATQIGERVIVTNAGANTGDWIATVAWYDSKWNPAEGDGVVLAAGDSPDPNIRKAGTEPGDAESYIVGGTAASITGTVAAANDNIVFRIGLTKAFTAYNANTNPARYAVVKLSYAGNTKNQLIFLRQGEGSDYVMRPGDKDGTGAEVVDNRSSAGKFAVYNITASAAEWAAATPGGDNMTDYPQLAVRGGTFTEYPSQGGAIFQGQGIQESGADMRRAYNHTPLATKQTPEGMSLAAVFNTYVNTEGQSLWPSSTNEICPTGWRRPNDGDPTKEKADTSGEVAVKGSEMRQSLHITPLTGSGNDTGAVPNTVFGYYADGFFDRRATETAPSDTASGTFGKGAVALSSVNAGFKGTLIFNPYSYNSIFLPCTGYRNASNMQLVGYRSYYWMSTVWNSSNKPQSCLFVGGTLYAAAYRQNRTMSFNIRCVKDE